MPDDVDLTKSVVKRCQRSVIKLERKWVDGKLKFFGRPEIEEYQTIVIDEKGKEKVVNEPFDLARQSFFISKQNA